MEVSAGYNFADGGDDLDEDEWDEEEEDEEEEDEE